VNVAFSKRPQTGRKWAEWLVFSLLVALAVALVGGHVARNESFSPLDEYVYFDYVSKVPTQGFVRTGEETGDAARAEIACRGVMLYGSYGDSCAGTTFETDGLYPYNGQTGADIYSPAYFAPTWAAAQAGVVMGLSPLDAARATGALWLGLGLCLLFLWIRSAGVGRKVGMGVVLVVAALPSTTWGSAYVSTDAPTLAVVSALGLLSSRVASGKTRPIWFALVAALAVLFKVQNIVAVGVFSFWLIGLAAVSVISFGTAQRSIARIVRELLRRPEIVAAFGALLLSVAVQVAWLATRKINAIPGEPVPLGEARESLTIPALVSESVKFLPQLGVSGMTPSLAGIISVTLISSLGLASAIGLIIWARTNKLSRVLLAGATLLAGLLMGPFLAVSAWAVSHYYFSLPARYGMVLIPIVAFLIAVSLSPRSRVVAWGMLVSGGILAAMAVLS
jgi:hypothetical protein